MAKRTEPSKDLVKVTGAPAYLQKYVEEDESLKGLEAFVVVPRLKIVHGMSDPETKKQFGEGTCIVRPGNQVVAKLNDPFHFQPLFFFSEYCLWSDRKDKENPMIRERSFDPTSEIAKRCADRDRRFEVYPEDVTKKPDQQKRLRYVHHFCFVGVINEPEHPLNGTRVTLSFEKGEYGNGKMFITAVKLRRIPLWAQIWELMPVVRSRDGNNWHGFNFKVDDENSVVAEVDVEKTKEEHISLARLHEEKRLMVDHAEPLEEEENETGAAEL